MNGPGAPNGGSTGLPRTADFNGAASDALPGLDLLRAFAAAALLLSHAAPLLLPLGIPLSVHLLLGYYGVEAFVLVCAFLLSRELLRDDAPRATLFLARQAWRWLPLYGLALALNLLLAAPTGAVLPSSTVSYVLLVQNLATPHPPFFGEAWFIPLLAWFALLLPLLCFTLKRWSRRSGAVLLIATLLAAHALRFAFIEIDDPTWHEGLRKTVLARLDLPLYGLAAGWWWRDGASRRQALACVGFALIAATCALYLALPLDRGVWPRLALFTLGDLGLVALLPLACAPAPVRTRAQAWLRACTRAIAAMAFVGCLTHLLLLRVLIAAGVDIQPKTAAMALAAFAAYVAAVIASSGLVWRALDRPWLALRERWLPRAAPHVAPVAERRGAGA